MTNRQLAEAYFATFSEADQNSIRAGWGGKDMLLEWYNNAVAAGAVPQEYAPGGSGGAQSGGTNFTGPGGKPTPSELRAWAKSQNWADDLGRFDDETLRRWITKSWDSTTNMFKSSRGAEGSYEKPVECPPGQGPSGPNEDDPCTTKGYGAEGEGEAGGPGGTPGEAETTKVGGENGADTLQQYLMELYGNQGGVFSPTSGAEGSQSGYVATPLEHGGVMWSPLGQPTQPSGPGGVPAPGECPRGSTRTIQEYATPPPSAAASSAPSPPPQPRAPTAKSARRMASATRRRSALRARPARRRWLLTSPVPVPRPSPPRPSTPSAPRLPPTPRRARRPRRVLPCPPRSLHPRPPHPRSLRSQGYRHPPPPSALSSPRSTAGTIRSRTSGGPRPAQSEAR